MAYPSALSNITNPLPTDKLNNPSHSSIHTAENTAIAEIQTFLGTLASTAGTLIYDVRAAASDGGGHVQSANKGGTGQTGYTKGDLLVATSQSVLSKLAVGADGAQLLADSTAASGVRWSPGGSTGNKIAVSGAVQTFRSSVSAIYAHAANGTSTNLNDGNDWWYALKFIPTATGVPVQAIIELAATSAGSGDAIYIRDQLSTSSPDYGSNTSVTWSASGIQTINLTGGQQLTSGNTYYLVVHVTSGTNFPKLVLDTSTDATFQGFKSPTAGANPTSSVFQNYATISISGNTASGSIEPSILSVTVPGSTLGVSNAVRATLFVSNIQQNSATGSVFLKMNYGSNAVGSVLLVPNFAAASAIGKIEYNLMANASSVLQRTDTYIDLKKQILNPGIVNSVISTLVRGTSSVNTSADQTMTITAQFADQSIGNYITVDGYTVEKIA